MSFFIRQLASQDRFSASWVGRNDRRAKGALSHALCNGSLGPVLTRAMLTPDVQYVPTWKIILAFILDFFTVFFFRRLHHRAFNRTIHGATGTKIPNPDPRVGKIA
jgi:hypothetical protein